MERTDFVGIYTQDLERSIKFYGGTLGLKRNESFEEVYDSGVCQMAFFKDPDGKALMLHCRYARYSDGSLP